MHAQLDALCRITACAFNHEADAGELSGIPLLKVCLKKDLDERTLGMRFARAAKM